MYDPLTAAHLQQALDTTWMGRTYLYLPVAGSTNDLLKKQAAAGDKRSPPAGTVLLADFQEQGRGRVGRRWEAPPGSSLLFSVLLRPDWPAEQLAWLTMIAGLAVAEAVEQQTAVRAHIKWPNDGVIKQEATWRKYCGILLEGHIPASGRLEHAVIGIGVNVNVRQDQLPHTDFPATSLLAFSGQPVSRLHLLANILSRLEFHYEQAVQNRSPLEAWQKRLIFMHERVAISGTGHNADLVGTAVGTDEQGRLLVQDSDGRTHYIAAGDVSLRASAPA